MKIITHDVFGELPADIREGVMPAPFDRMPAARRLLELHSVDPDHSDSDHAKVEMVDHRVGGSALGMRASDLLLEFLETGFDLPSSPIVLDDLVDGKVRSVENSATHFVLR